MVEKKKKQVGIKNKYFLFGPVSFVSLILLDVIGGLNFPGYIWLSNVINDITSFGSYRFVLCFIFGIIYLVLTIISGYFIIKFFKYSNFNNILKNGIKLITIASIVFALSSAIFILPESGIYKNVKKDAVIGIKTETVEDGDGNLTQSVDKFDIDATIVNINKAVEYFSHPMTIVNGIAVFIATILSIVSLIMIIIGGYNKKGKYLFAGLGIFFIVLVLFAITELVGFCSPDSIGFNSRLIRYSVALLPAFFCAYAYITNIEK